MDERFPYRSAWHRAPSSHLPAAAGFLVRSKARALGLHQARTETRRSTSRELESEKLTQNSPGPAVTASKKRPIIPSHHPNPMIRQDLWLDFFSKMFGGPDLVYRTCMDVHVRPFFFLAVARMSDFLLEAPGEHA